MARNLGGISNGALFGPMKEGAVGYKDFRNIERYVQSGKSQ